MDQIFIVQNEKGQPVTNDASSGGYPYVPGIINYATFFPTQEKAEAYAKHWVGYTVHEMTYSIGEVLNTPRK